MSVKDETKEQMQHAIDHLKSELHSLRTGRANPAMVSGLKVQVYGTDMRLQDIASVNVPEPQMLQITAFDSNNVSAISKAIHQQLEMMAEINGAMVLLRIPPMSEERRGQMTGRCKKLGEEAKVAIRKKRQDANNKERKRKAEGEIGEDELKRSEKVIQDLTDLFCKQIDDLCTAKEKEINTI